MKGIYPVCVQVRGAVSAEAAAVQGESGDRDPEHQGRDEEGPGRAQPRRQAEVRRRKIFLMLPENICF